MKRSRRAAVIGITILALGGAQAAPAPRAPNMSSAWLAIDVSQDECVNRSSGAMKRNGFATKFEVLANSAIYGERGDYTALVRCVSEKGIAYFVVAGPNATDCTRLMSAIRKDF